tara:strand:+ start:2529 stop:2690 length:162 start_codon:yes stop_codon:yes gene_type:complete
MNSTTYHVYKDGQVLAHSLDKDQVNQLKELLHIEPEIVPVHEPTDKNDIEPSY